MVTRGNEFRCFAYCRSDLQHGTREGGGGGQARQGSLAAGERGWARRRQTGFTTGTRRSVTESALLNGQKARSQSLRLLPLNAGTLEAGCWAARWGSPHTHTHPSSHRAIPPALYTRPDGGVFSVKGPRAGQFRCRGRRRLRARERRRERRAGQGKCLPCPDPRRGELSSPAPQVCLMLLCSLAYGRGGRKGSPSPSLTCCGRQPAGRPGEDRHALNPTPPFACLLPL
jgi:hypothetical protein